MSFIIEYLTLPLPSSADSAASRKKEAAHAATSLPGTQDHKESENALSNKDQGVKQTQNWATSLQHYFLQANINITLRKHLIYRPETSRLYYTLNLILNQEKYIKIVNRERRLILFKTISQKITLKSQQNLTFTFHPHSGVVKIVLFNGCVVFEDGCEDRLSSFVNKFYKFEQLKEYLLTLLTGTITESHFVSSEEAHSNPQLRNIKRTIPKIGTGLSISSNNRAESSIVNGYAAQKLKMQKILQNLMNPSQSELLQLSLYCKAVSAKNRGQIFFSQHELSSISNKIKPPALAKCKNLFENNCILNYIKINSPERLNLTKIGSGGFSHIFFTEIQYWYVFSGSENEVIALNSQTFSKENMFKKAVVFKREENKPAQSRSRVLHEKAILKQIKNGNALYVPKYYVPLNEAAQNKTLFCDYISNPNLSEYMYLHRQTLSPASKTLILLMLVQGIRFLSDYKVYHLDLKPQNVMITKSMMVKIIDFGESYHSEVCNDDFIPGFTMPYGAPETYYPIDSSSFSSKNDIFSLGVIASELMNNRLPFYFSKEESHFERYAESNFQDYWFYSPEELEERNDPRAFGFMQLVIGRCLDVRAERRPDLNWLCLIFREFLDFYY